MHIKIGDQIELIIEGLGVSGEGVGDYQGLKIFVDGALPQELVLVEILVCKKNYAIAKLLNIIKTSIHRAKPICPIFEKCGGCQIMHLSYPAQLESKKKKILDAFQRIAKSPILENIEVVPSPKIYNYRNKIQLPAAPSNQGVCLGLYAKKSHRIIPTNKCYIHTDLGELVFEKITELLQTSSIEPYQELHKTGELRHVLIRTAVNSKQVLVVLITAKQPSEKIRRLAKLIHQIPHVLGVVHHKNAREDNVVFDEQFTLLEGQPRIQENLHEMVFHVSAASFFQVNTEQALQLYQYAIDCAGIDSSTTVLDAYCGVGTLSLMIAKKASKVIGVECVEQAIMDAKENAKNNSISNVEFFCSKTEAFLGSIRDIDTVFVNPPRKGCELSVLEQLHRLGPKTVIYISCDPATLARDVKILEEFGFKKDKVKGFDMFPQTMHVETVVCLKR